MSEQDGRDQGSGMRTPEGSVGDYLGGRMLGLEVAGRRRRGGSERRRAEAADWLWPPQKRTAFQEVEDVMLKKRSASPLPGVWPQRRPAVRSSGTFFFSFALSHGTSLHFSVCFAFGRVICKR